MGEVTFRILDQRLEQIADEGLIIHLYGLTQENKSVYCKVLRYQPYCWLELPSNINWNGPKIGVLKEYIQGRLSECPPDVMKFEIKKLAMYSVTRPFLRINFKTEDSIRHLKNLLRFKWKIEGFRSEFEPNAFKLHEHNIPVLVKFGMERKIDMAGWITAKVFKPNDPKFPKDYSYCDYSVYTTAKWVRKADVDSDLLVDPLICSFDIELHSINRKSSSPAADVPENVITMVSLCFGRLSEELESWDTYVITLYAGDKDPDGKYKSTVINCKGSEKKLLVEFTKLVKKKKPDVMTGYNINGFDWGALLKRAEINEVKNRFFRMGKLKYEKDYLKDDSWSSGARGKQEIVYVKMNGVFNFDMYPEIRFNHNLPMYKLGYVAEKFLGTEEGKDDMPYQQMFALFEMIEILERSLENCEDIDVKTAKKLILSKVEKEELIEVPGMTNHVAEFYRDLKVADSVDKVVKTAREYMLRLIKYVIQDARICPALMKFLNSLTSLWENANVSKCPPNYVYEKGQQIKVLAQYLEKAHWRNFVIPYYTKAKEEVKEDDDDDDKKNYQGATVLKVKKGLYKDIAILDFKSLYPSIMITYNICHTTFRLNDDKRVKDEDCHIAQWSEHIRCQHDPEFKGKKKRKGDSVYCGDHKYRFIKHNGDDNKKGLLPLLLEELLAARKRVKKQMFVHESKWKELKLKLESDGLSDEEKAEMTLAYRKAGVLDARQLAIKVSANSAYGFMGATTGYFPLVAGAASVTYYGRDSINKTISMVEAKFPPAEVIYGDTDSVFVDFHDPDLKRAFKTAFEAGDYVTNQLPGVLELEMENFYSPLLLLTKKRYEYSIINDDGVVLKDGSKGSINKRRDNCDAARDIYTFTLKSVMSGQSQEETVYEINQQILEMFRGRVPLHNFVIYKGLKNTVEEYKKCVGHVLFAKRLEDRGNVLKAGTRLEYVFIKKYGKDLKSGDVMEDWSYFLMNRHSQDLHIDYGYYLEHNIMKPVTEVLNIAYPATQRQFYKPDEAFKMAMDVYLKPSWMKMLRGHSMEKKALYIAKHSKQKRLRDAAKTFAARSILDRLYKQHGLRKRKYHRPKMGQSHIFLNDKIIHQIAEYHHDWAEVKNQIKNRINLPEWIALRW